MGHFFFERPLCATRGVRLPSYRTHFDVCNRSNAHLKNIFFCAIYRPCLWYHIFHGEVRRRRSLQRKKFPNIIETTYNITLDGR